MLDTGLEPAKLNALRNSELEETPLEALRIILRTTCQKEPKSTDDEALLELLEIWDSLSPKAKKAVLATANAMIPAETNPTP